MLMIMMMIFIRISMMITINDMIIVIPRSIIANFKKSHHPKLIHQNVIIPIIVILLFSSNIFLETIITKQAIMFIVLETRHFFVVPSDHFSFLVQYTFELEFSSLLLLFLEFPLKYPFINQCHRNLCNLRNLKQAGKRLLQLSFRSIFCFVTSFVITIIIFTIIRPSQYSGLVDLQIELFKLFLLNSRKISSQTDQRIHKIE